MGSRTRGSLKIMADDKLVRSILGRGDAKGVGALMNQLSQAKSVEALLVGIDRELGKRSEPI